MDYADLVRPGTFADDDRFHALAAHMRAHEPVARIESETHHPFYAVTKHADIIEIEKQHGRFLNTINSVLTTKTLERQAEESGTRLRTLVQMDDPDHTLFRDLTKDWFLPQNLKKLEQQVQALAEQAVERMLALGREVDFVKDVAVWFPLRVIMMILGVPEEDEARMLKLTQELFGAEDPDMRRERSGKGAQSDAEARLETLLGFVNYFTEMTEDRRKNPRDDVATVIANAKINGEPIGHWEAISYYTIIATAGHDTTSSSIAGGLLALMQHPDELKKVQQQPEILPLAIDEAIRWTTPVKHFLRHATEDYRLRDVQIKAGDRLMMLYPSGNRDEEVFDQPFAFLADRRPNRHLAFGHGAHHCLGNILAKMEMRCLYEALFARLAGVELNGEPQLVRSYFVSGLKTLPIRIKVR